MPFCMVRRSWTPHYGAAWAWAGNTPFKWGKQVGSHLGGTRNPMVDPLARARHRPGRPPVAVHTRDRRGPDDPRRRRDPGTRGPSTASSRSRCTARRSPRRSATQPLPSTGPSSTSRRSGTARCTRTAGGSRSKTARIPWVLTPDAIKPYAPGVWDPDDDPTELYYLPDDFTQANDLAAEHPDKVAGAEGSVLAGGRAVQGAAAARDAVDVLRHAPADPEGDDLRVPRGRPERHVRDDPADLQPVVLDQRRTRRAGGRRRGRHRGGGRPPGWLHAVREGRASSPTPTR